MMHFNHPISYHNEVGGGDPNGGRTWYMGTAEDCNWNVEYQVETEYEEVEEEDTADWWKFWK